MYKNNNSKKLKFFSMEYRKHDAKLEFLRRKGLCGCGCGEKVYNGKTYIRFHFTNTIIKDKGNPEIAAYERIEGKIRRHFQKVKSLILDRDEYTCKNCKKKFKKRIGSYYSIIHHIKPIRKFIEEGIVDPEIINSEKNLILLCSKCHTSIERNANKDKNVRWKTSEKAIELIENQKGV